MSGPSPETATRLRAMLRGRLTCAALATLAADLNAAVADYRDRRHNQADDESAQVFAAEVAADVQRLLTTIERRRRAVGRVVPLAPHKLLTLATAPWLPILRDMQAQAQREADALQRPRGRPQDEPRLWCACAVADALARAGIPPTKAKTGAFAQVLRTLVYPALDLPDRDVEHTVRAAVDALPTWRRRLDWRRVAR